MEGKKFDQDKIRTDLLPIEALESVAEVLTFGAKKYGDRNWEKGLSWSRLHGATLRHLFSFWKGEDIDPESGSPHLAHAACCILMLLQHQVKDLGKDDRPESESQETVKIGWDELLSVLQNNLNYVEYKEIGNIKRDLGIKGR